MDVSSKAPTGMQESTNKAQESQSVIKKAIDVQEKQVLQTIDAAVEQSKEVTAQKTGMGNGLNITA